MIDTAISRVNNKICAIIKNLVNLIGKLGPDLLIKVISRCPAIMFAVSRIARVPGRIIFLIDSISTKNGNRILGAPCGTRWANIWVVFRSHPKIMNLNHKGSLKDRVILI